MTEIQDQTNQSQKQKESERNPRGSIAFLFILLVAIEQTVKHFAYKVFRNYQFAFSLPVPIWLIYPVYGIIILAIIYYLFGNYKNLSVSARLAWILILAGAASNIGERIALGYVRDFIYISFYRWTGIYNLADGYIILGIIILLWPTLKKSDGKN